MLVVPLFFIFIKFNHIETIWLNLHKARALNCIGEHLQSFAIAIDVAKQKTGDYWAWELLGLGVTGLGSYWAIFNYISIKTSL
jgi:hypothetical protein